MRSLNPLDPLWVFITWVCCLWESFKGRICHAVWVESKWWMFSSSRQAASCKPATSTGSETMAMEPCVICNTSSSAACISLCLLNITLGSHSQPAVIHWTKCLITSFLFFSFIYLQGQHTLINISVNMPVLASQQIFNYSPLAQCFVANSHKMYKTKTTECYKDSNCDKNGDIFKTRHKPCKATVASRNSTAIQQQKHRALLNSEFSSKKICCQS